MIVHGVGDLLVADADALVNTVNCVGVMGKGIALQFKRRYPENFDAYAKACKSGEVRLGHMHVVELHSISGPRYVVNFPTKGHWKSRSKLEDIEAGLDDLIRVIRDLGIKSIAIPPLGAGNGGLAWSEVEPLIRRKLAGLPDVRVMLFTPSNAARHLSPDPVKMTWGRATLIELIRAYTRARLAVEPWEDVRGASHLEIQKLMYFAQLVMPQLTLRFEQGIYGPYSEQVRHLVQSMEGTFVTGLGDGTAPVQRLDPIAPTAEGVAEVENYLERAGQEKDIRSRIVDPVMRMIDGFEGPYAIELIASTHWVARQPGCDDAHAAWRAIQAWTPRKGRLFTEHHVATAWEQLDRIERLVADSTG
ncbi:type II toxin-antitoxin system antitoxin DNA ADP-ribosyl glycohydrolase DarG [Saccharothrix coeruleofusca]|uniref:Macro domain-containing protein n=1 Tax=Saccharothrix coeruleofusca TaxID=33919 RepID=A0A918EG28_9PSEU|nr:macro domain-containing protein [Saccharothrix coeruleofusca]GGP70177.1 hypothetical protein GCM10010185_48990 [Saccharothrix coeruleofusca]